MRILRNYFLLLVFALSINSVSYGQDINYAGFGIETNGSNIPHGLKAGDKAPDFIGYDQKGKQVELKKILEQGPVILFFYRGKWCPVCSRYLNDYQDSLKVLTDQGLTLLLLHLNQLKMLSRQ